MTSTNQAILVKTQILTTDLNQIVKTAKDATSADVDLTDYLRDLFASNYGAFLLSFGMGDLLETLG